MVNAERGWRQDGKTPVKEEAEREGETLRRKSVIQGKRGLREGGEDIARKILTQREGAEGKVKTMSEKQIQKKKERREVLSHQNITTIIVFSEYYLLYITHKRFTLSSPEINQMELMRVLIFSRYSCAMETDVHRIHLYYEPDSHLQAKKKVSNWDTHVALQISFKSYKCFHYGSCHKMHKSNISHIFLLGFPQLHGLNILIFISMLLIYCVTICGNIIIITLISINKKLHSPMYFFITQVSVLDILMTTDILPNFLHIVLHGGATMSLAACILQFYVFANTDSSECLILMVMSYDRYLAICNPLRYNGIINKAFCIKTVIASWFLSALVLLIIETDIYKLEFCASNVIDHFFCDFPPLLELACSDTSLIPIHTALVGLIGLISPFIMIIVSYVYIITTILKIRSISGRQKAFSTCSSHLTVVCIFFGTLLSVYIVPAKGELLSTSKALSLLYTVVTPLLNPFIYSLRNKDFKEAFEKLKHFSI
ncbi:olfactory receptor 6N1-like [Pseudophryne corroboree]|uniref:olfactory receptor 6N1-like n=1 Tax=Pseudophryne corroboree TaxID=495146 RepID=UPI003081E448